MITRPLYTVWPYALIYWAAFFWAFLPEFAIVGRAERSQHGRHAAPRDTSLRIIVIGLGLSVFIAFQLAWIPALRFGPSGAMAAFWIGLAVLVVGSLLRRHCWRTLGASFTGNVQARAEQQVVSRGAYRYLRHPSYTGGLLMNVGLGLALGSWASALVLAAGAFGVYMYRIHVEERTLATVIGEPYREFMRTRKRLVPFVY